MQRDASNNSIGAVLLQDFEDGEHPIVYLHRVLTSAEQNYSPTEKECLALLWAIKKLRPYLDGYKFKAITDHSALRWLQNLRDPSGRLARWALDLQQWDLDIVHRKGAMQSARRPLHITEDMEVEEIAAFEAWNHQKLVAIQEWPHKFRD